MAIPCVAPEPLTCAQIRAIDARAIGQLGIPGIVLMENAARAVAEAVYDLLSTPPDGHVLILCGGGNNGGDGFAAARHLMNAGVRVTVVLAAHPERLSPDAATNHSIFLRMRGAVIDALEPGFEREVMDLARSSAVIVDALLGTGSQGAPRGPAGELIRIANSVAGARKVAIDIPSGLDADEGRVWDPCFRADVTVTLVAPKVGFAKDGAGGVLGRVVVADIGAPRTASAAGAEKKCGKGLDS